MPEAFFCMWLKPTDSYIQKDNSHGIRTSVTDQKSLLTMLIRSDMDRFFICNFSAFRGEVIPIN